MADEEREETKAQDRTDEDAEKGTEEREAEAGGQDATDEDAGEGVEDSHGHPGINREKYRRDMQAKDDEIARLRSMLDEKAKTEEGRAELKRQLDDLEARSADERATYELKLAGCTDERAIKAAKALLDDYDGDVDRLRDECPFLFSKPRETGSTGLPPEGGADGAAEAERVDSILSKYR